MEICCQHHPECGEDKTVIALAPKLGVFRVVDVKNMCIVEQQQPSQQDYLTLSYVWGLVGTLRLRRNNVAHLMLPGALKVQEHHIPKTIRDSLELVRLLGHQYIWIDSLCLIEDDPEDLISGIRVMDVIYERSILTIIATGDDAGAGLPGVEEGSRKASQLMEEVRPGVKMAFSFHLGAYLNTSKYSTRGWT